MDTSVPGRGTPAHFFGGLLVVLATSIAVRSVGLGTWSMWEDEAGSLTRAYEDPTRGFQGYFPIFFVVLRAYADLVGLSVGALRILPAACGVGGIALIMVAFRRRVNSRTLILSGLLLSLNLGHVFFSQSVRYYTLLMLFEILALAWFHEALEKFSTRTLLTSLVAWVFALLTHFSALLLLPVFATYIAFTLLFHRDRLSWLAGATGAVAAIGGFFSWRMMRLQQEMIGDWALPSQRDPVHLGTTMVAYIGLPLLVLGVLSPWLARGLTVRTRVFLLAAGFIPLLELLTLAAMNFVNVTWYYAIVSLAALPMLASSSIVSLWDRGARLAAGGAAALAAAYSIGFLALYFSISHGDRPRWADAADFARLEYGLRPGNPDAPPAFSNVPGPVTFHLGEPPEKCEDDRIVLMLPKKLDESPPNSVFIVELKGLRSDSIAWLELHCERAAEFEAKTGPADRTVRVYRSRQSTRN